MENIRKVLYFMKPPLVDNKKLIISAYETDSKETPIKFLAQYTGYYRYKSETVVLYPLYNKYAWEQNKAREHKIPSKLIRYN